MIDRELLKRIRKCLALSSSSNEHEAAAALAKGLELMREHGITDEMLELAEIEEATARAASAISPPVWQRTLVAVVRRALNVEAFLDGADWRFVGRGPTAEIASYAFAALFRRLRQARAEHIRTQLRRCKPARKRVRADAFCEGWVSAVFVKVRALAPDREPDAAVVAYLQRQFPGLVPVKPRRAGSDEGRTARDYWRGVDQGRVVDLHHGVGGAAPQQVIAHG